MEIKMVSRRYRRRRNFNKIANNYFKAKLSISKRIGYDTAGVKFLEDNVDNKSVSSLLSECPDMKKFQQLFQSMKLTGILMETAPNPISEDTVAPGSITLGLQTRNDTDVFADVVEGNYGMLLSPMQCQRKYISMTNGLTGWIATDGTITWSPRFSVKTNANAQAGGYMIAVRFTFYVTFKNSN